jgi:hypothetical protein
VPLLLHQDIQRQRSYYFLNSNMDSRTMILVEFEQHIYIYIYIGSTVAFKIHLIVYLVIFHLCMLLSNLGSFHIIASFERHVLQKVSL